MFSVDKKTQYSFVIEKSKFIATLSPAKCEQDARGFIADIKKEYNDATHNCYAYITDNGLTTKSSDDGEPSGTAGCPILDTIKHNNLTNVVLVVTRYFGGIKLGTGGLVRAYTDSANGVIKNSKVLEFFECVTLQTTLDYQSANTFLREYKNYFFNEPHLEYSEKTTITFSILKTLFEDFNKNFKLRFNSNLTILKEVYLGK